MNAPVFFGLGSNLGNRENNIQKAIEKLGFLMGGRIVSSIYETEPMYEIKQPKFLNAVIGGYTNLGPAELLQRTKSIEDGIGKHKHNQPRAIDIDILFLGHEIVEAKDLVIPHPMIEERAFVLVPFVEIAPDFIHPKRGVTIEKLLSNLGKIKGVQKI